MPQHDMFHTVLQTIFSPKFKQIFNIYTRSSIVADRALNHARFRAAMHPILNYLEFRTNHEPHMAHGVVHGGLLIADWKIPD